MCSDIRESANLIAFLFKVVFKDDIIILDVTYFKKKLY